MEQTRIDRINELSRLSRERELTDEEKAERAKLREEYIAAFRRNLAGTLDNIYLVDEKGNEQKLKMKES